MEDMVRIPQNRLGILIGPKGATKKELEKTFNVSITVEDTGCVLIKGEEGLSLWNASKAVKGIGRGFNLEAVKELSKDDYDLVVINLESLVGRKHKDIERYKARIIGQNGKTKKYIENITGASICLSGKTVSIIGKIQDVHDTNEAINIIMDGAEIKTVYAFLHKVKMSREEAELFKM